MTARRFEAGSRRRDEAWLGQPHLRWPVGSKGVALGRVEDPWETRCRHGRRDDRAGRVWRRLPGASEAALGERLAGDARSCGWRSAEGEGGEFRVWVEVVMVARKESDAAEEAREEAKGYSMSWP